MRTADALDTRSATAWQWRATGTRWRIHHSGELSLASAERAIELVAADEARWSRFLDDSDVARLTRGAGRHVRISEETLTLLEACAHWQRRSRGRFHPLVGRALSEWGYGRSLSEWPAGVAHRPVARRVSGVIEIDRTGCSACIPAGTALDLGGIAKGWMAARIGRWLARAAGDAQLLVDAGGDIVAVRGDHRVSVDHGHGVLAIVELRAGQAIATSGSAARSWLNGDRTAAHHLIDPSTGMPAAPSVATVVASDVVTADVLATCLALEPKRVARLRRPALVTDVAGQRSTLSWDVLARR